MRPKPRPGEGAVDPVVLAAAMRSHVDRLAADVGEPNAFRPSALAAARDYITSQWQSQGYASRLTGMMLASFLAPTLR
jgi:hypothetical protein